MRDKWVLSMFPQCKYCEIKTIAKKAVRLIFQNFDTLTKSFGTEVSRLPPLLRDTNCPTDALKKNPVSRFSAEGKLFIFLLTFSTTFPFTLKDWRGQDKWRTSAQRLCCYAVKLQNQNRGRSGLVLGSVLWGLLMGFPLSPFYFVPHT